MDKENFNHQIFQRTEQILKHLRGELSPQEEEAFQRWLAEDEQHRNFLESLSREEGLKEELEFFSSTDVSQAWKNISKKTVKREMADHHRRSAVWKYAAVIVIVGLAGCLAYLVFSKGEGSLASEEMLVQNADEIGAPGGSKARLELSDGAVVILDEVKDGDLDTAGASRITKKSGQLVYTPSDGKAPQQLAYHTIHTPRGGEYQLVLPDGSKVWLNAASSLRFPTSFNDKERIVEMTGEAYFEIKTDKSKPFTVWVEDVEIEVLGTHFNVSAYKDNYTINATLLEGSVSIRKDEQFKEIAPGQQARIDEDIQVLSVDTSEAVAWKNGMFLFNKTKLEHIMRQLARWYNIEADYSQMPEKYYTGSISKDHHISEVLNMLELTGDISFRLEGKKVMVLNP